MLIREVMNSNIVTISPNTKLNDAYSLMQGKKIRHLPVLENNKLVGVVTDRDLRLATSQLSKLPFDPETIVAKVMTSPVNTAHPLDPIEIATQVMRELKIGCMPVVENSTLIGMVTTSDLLDALLLLTGVHQPSGRIDILLPNRSGELARLTALLAEHKVNIHSILTYPDKEGKIKLVLRISTMEIKFIAQEICNSGFEVVFPLNIACAK